MLTEMAVSEQVFCGRFSQQLFFVAAAGVSRCGYQQATILWCKGYQSSDNILIIAIKNKPCYELSNLSVFKCIIAKNQEVHNGAPELQRAMPSTQCCKFGASYRCA